MRPAACAVCGVPGQFVREDRERARQEPGCAVRVPAGSAAGDEACPPHQRLGIGPGLSEGQLLEAVRDRREAVDARAALACALAGEVPQHARTFGDGAGGLGEDDHGACPQGRGHEGVG